MLMEESMLIRHYIIITVIYIIHYIINTVTPANVKS